MNIERIRDFRIDLGMSQQQMAAELGIAQRTYSGYECGSRNIPNGILVKIAQYHSTSVDYLLGLTDERSPYPSVVSM